MPRGSAYLCAVMDRGTRKVLGWAISNTMDAGLCLRALQQALDTTGVLPEIMNTDQGSQFTGEEWLRKLTSVGVK
jgi:putative transposase